MESDGAIWKQCLNDGSKCLQIAVNAILDFQYDDCVMIVLMVALEIGCLNNNPWLRELRRMLGKGMKNSKNIGGKSVNWNR